MRPEDKARLEIDRALGDAGWVVQDMAALNLAAGPGVAVREFPLQAGHGFAVAHLFRASPHGGTPWSQRDVMCRIWAKCRCDEACAEREYADAERLGDVVRARNTHHFTAEADARALLRDGLRKGWLRPCDDPPAS